MTGSQSSNNLRAFSARAAQPRSVLGRAGKARSSHAGPCSAEPLESRLLLASISWDGGGDGASWSDPANWSGDRLPRPRDVVVIGADATVDIGGKGERITVRRLESEGSITLRGGTLRTKGPMHINGEINVLANSTLRAGNRFQLGAITEGEGTRLVLRGPSIFVSQSAHISGLSRLTAFAADELWFAGAATAPMITLNGGDTARTVVTGALDASAARPRGEAGTIHILGRDIYLHGAEIDTRSRFGGGDVRIGGDYSGRGELPRAQRVYIDSASIIRADAKRLGDGGTVIVWSDARTIFNGRISASAGRLGGDGGLIETSSKGLLSVGSGLATAVANRGTGGTWLMDPYDILVSEAPDSNIVITPGDPLIFMGNGTEATVSTSSITAALNVGTSVTITTEGAGGGAGDILILDDIAKTAGGEATLTFIADRDVILVGSISSSSGPLNVVIQAAGDFDASVGSISTGGGMLQVSADTIFLGVTASINTSDGNFLLSSTQSMSLLGGMNMGSGFGNIESVAGNINANTSIQAAGVQFRAYAGSVQVVVVEALVIEIEAANNITLGSGAGGSFLAFSYLDAHAGTDGTGSVGFGSLVQVFTSDVRLRAGDGEGGAAASATVDVLTNSPIFQSVDGGGTTPEFFSIRQDAAISDAQIPGPASFGSSSMPDNLSLRSDDASLTITSPAKVLGVNLAVAAVGTVSLGLSGQTLLPATLTYDNTPPATLLAGTLETSIGGISFPSNLVLTSPMVSIVSPEMIEFVGTINGAATLSVDSPMLMDFVGAIGNITPLLALATTSGTARFYSNVTAATITVNSAAVIFYTVTMTAATAGPTFQSTLTINGTDELRIRGASPEFNGGPDSVAGSGFLGIAPASAAAAMDVGGTFLTPASLAAIAPGFALNEFGDPVQSGALTVQTGSFVNDTRFVVGDAFITHFSVQMLNGAGVVFEIAGQGSTIHQGSVLTSGGPITYNGPLIVNTGFGLFGTTQNGAATGADITFNSTVYPGDGQYPVLEFRAGETGIVTLAQGLSEQSFAFQSLSVFGGPGGAIRTFGDIWLGDSGTEFFDTESPLELGSDVTINVSNARFLNGLRSFGSSHSLIIFGSGNLELHGVNLANLESTFISGETRLHGEIDIDGFAQINGPVRVLGIGDISAGTLHLNGEVDLNGLDLSLSADFLDIGDDIFGGGGVSTLTIAPRSANQGVSINETDSGLWLSALELSRIQDGLANLIFGRLDGTAQLTIGTTSFSNPVEFRMAGPGASIGLIGTLTGTDDASITFFGSGGTTTLLGNITTESEPIVFNDAVLIAVPLVTLSTIGNESPGADIVFNGLVGSTGGEANSLQLQAGIGNIEFNGGVGIVPGDELGNLTTDAGGGEVLISGGFIATVFNQVWNRPITLLADTVLCGQTGFITINQPISAGAFNLTLKSDDVNINAALSGTGDLKIAPFTLTRDVYINLSPLGGGALIIDQTEKSQIQDGWNNVTFGEQGGDAQMVVGGGDYSDPTEFVMSGMGGASSVQVVQEISGSGNGTIIIRGGGSTTHLFASIITQGNAITIFDRVILRTPLVSLDSTNGGAFPMGGKIEIHGDVDSQNAMGHSLLIDPGLDELELFGELGNGDGGLLGMFTTGPFGTAILRGGVIKTIGQQLYQGPVLIPTDLFLSTLGAPIVFEEEVTGDENLTIGEGSGETSFEDETSFESLTIEFGDTRTFNGPTTIGTLTVLGGIVNFNAAGKIGGGTLVSGVLSGSDVAYIDGEFEWQGGLVEGDGLLVIRPSGVFSFGGASERTLARDLQVEGVLLWTSGHLYLRDSLITILNGGVFDVRSSGTMLPENGSQGQIVNQGLIERTFPGAAAMVDLTVTNTGEIRITNGSLKITPLSGTFTNDGALTLGPVGSLIVRGDYVHAATATLNIIIAGTGVGHFGRLIVLGEAILDGHVATSFHDEYVPSAGDEYHFLQADSRTGTFATQSIDPPPAGLLANIAYDPDGARLVISAALFGDTDGDGQLTVHDIFMFLENWFNGDGDFDGDGETTVNDIFAFLTAWFAQ